MIASIIALSITTGILLVSSAVFAVLAFKYYQKNQELAGTVVDMVNELQRQDSKEDDCRITTISFPNTEGL